MSSCIIVWWGCSAVLVKARGVGRAWEPTAPRADTDGVIFRLSAGRQALGERPWFQTRPSFYFILLYYFCFFFTNSLNPVCFLTPPVPPVNKNTVKQTPFTQRNPAPPGTTRRCRSSLGAAITGGHHRTRAGGRRKWWRKWWRRRGGVVKRCTAARSPGPTWRPASGAGCASAGCWPCWRGWAPRLRWAGRSGCGECCLLIYSGNCVELLK